MFLDFFNLWLFSLLFVIVGSLLKWHEQIIIKLLFSGRRVR